MRWNWRLRREGLLWVSLFSITLRLNKERRADDFIHKLFP